MIARQALDSRLLMVALIGMIEIAKSKKANGRRQK